MTNWFEASTSGLRQLQAGKPKYHIIRELIQNALDEPIKECKVITKHDKGFTTILVEDDSPIGFRDIKDSYTLFKDTYKRKDPGKRGRFNAGEKQAFCRCKEAVVSTTTGSIRFDSKGRHRLKEKRENGTLVTVIYRDNKKDYRSMLKYVRGLYVPKNIKVTFNGVVIRYQKPMKSFEAILRTEIDTGVGLQNSHRKTRVDIHKNNSESMLYEMGIPICEIGCAYSIDVQQKVPMSIDRETVSQACLQDLFAEVLNHIYEDIEEEKSSQVWIRQAMSDKRITREAIESIIKKRFGNKVCIATPNDPNSIDDAIADGCKVIYGRELSKEEWGNIRRFGDNGGLISSTGNKYGKGIASFSRTIEPNENMLKVVELIKKIALRMFGIDVVVRFIETDATQIASYGGGVLTFNLLSLSEKVFNGMNVRLLELVIHELAHHYGKHTEKEYHSAMEKLGAGLVILALNEPEFFEMKERVE